MVDIEESHRIQHPKEIRNKNLSNIFRGEERLSDRDPISIPTLLDIISELHPNQSALAFKNEEGQWIHVNYKNYKLQVYHYAKIFINLGLQPRHSVGILAFNCKEWFYSELAAIHAGGIATGIYITNSPDAVYHVLEISKANIAVADDAYQIEKIRQVRNRLPLLKAVIQINSPFHAGLKAEEGYYKWEDLNISEEHLPDMEDEFNQRLQSIDPNECCTFVFTSGTVGYPKGVMLSHDNITWSALAFIETFDLWKEVVISYLPLSHSAAKACDIYIIMMIAGTTYFADKNALKYSLGKTIQEVRPTRFLAVPRVYEKIQEKMVAVGRQSGRVKKKLVNWAKKVTLDHHLTLMEGKRGGSGTFQYKLAKRIVISKVKKALGFDRCVTFFTAAAPIPLETKNFFLSLDMILSDVFGMSECTGGHSMSPPNSRKMDSVGKPPRAFMTKIHNPEENGYGEICMKGRHVFMGYVNDPEGTKAALDADGWLHSGDIGYVDKDGYLYISGRLKEIIITAGGENIPPTFIENLVKQKLPGVSNVFLVGDKRKYLTVLITIKTRMENNAPTDDLNEESLKWMEDLGLKYQRVSEILNAGPCPKVLESIQLGIDKANLQAISNAQRIQKFAILPKDFSIPTGELGPTLKVKRNVVLEKYADIIDDLYKV